MSEAQGLPELPEPAEGFVFGGLDWHRAEPSYFKEAAGEKIQAFSADQMRDYARAALAATQQAGAVPEGFALVPIRATAAMDDIMQEEGWQWPDVLAAAKAITAEQYDEACLPATTPSAEPAACIPPLPNPASTELSRLTLWLNEHPEAWDGLDGTPVDVAIAAMQRADSDGNAEEINCAEEVLDSIAAGLEMEQTHFDCVGDYIEAVVAAIRKQAATTQAAGAGEAITDEQAYAMATANFPRWRSDICEEFVTELVRAVEAHHGIVGRAVKEVKS